MSQQVKVTIDDVEHDVDVDLTAKRWTSPHAYDEGDYPLIAEIDGKRYELYSDGTLGEEEL
jgi:hypothetical protein